MDTAIPPVPRTPVVPAPAGPKPKDAAEQPPVQLELDLDLPAPAIGYEQYNPKTHFLQPKITGYRQLTPNETQLINDIKRLERDALLMVEALALEKDFDQRWVAIAKTDLQKGYMALVRSVARPGS